MCIRRKCDYNNCIKNEAYYGCRIKMGGSYGLGAMNRHEKQGLFNWIGEEPVMQYPNDDNFLNGSILQDNIERDKSIVGIDNGGNVFLKGLDNGSDVKLTEYCIIECKELCKGIFERDVYTKEYEEFITDCNCSVATLYWVCLGLAHTQDKLSRYEYIG